MMTLYQSLTRRNYIFMELKFRNMEWITTKHIQSTDGKTEKIYCELLLKFPTSEWNKKDKSIAIL